MRIQVKQLAVVLHLPSHVIHSFASELCVSGCYYSRHQACEYCLGLHTWSWGFDVRLKLATLDDHMYWLRIDFGKRSSRHSELWKQNVSVLSMFGWYGVKLSHVWHSVSLWQRRLGGRIMGRVLVFFLHMRLRIRPGREARVGGGSMRKQVICKRV